MKRYWLVVWSVLATLLALFLAAEALGIGLSRDPAVGMRSGGAVAALSGVGLLIADVFLPVPSAGVMIAHGALFGVAVGTLLSLAGSVGAAVVGFAIGRAGGPLLERLVPPDERRRAARLLERWGALAIVATRPLPLVAETVVILAGASPLGWTRAMVAALAGTLPAALLYAFAGAVAAGLGSALLVFTGVVLMSGVFWLLGRRLGGRLPEHEGATP